MYTSVVFKIRKNIKGINIAPLFTPNPEIR